MRRVETVDVPNTDLTENNASVVCDTILSMFGPRWTKPDAERLVQYTNGNLDIAVQEILKHDATGKSPMEWMRSEDSESFGIRDGRTQSMDDIDESKSETISIPAGNNWHKIDTDLVRFLLSERDGNQHKEINNAQQQQVEDRKPSALSGDYKHQNEPSDVFVPPVDNSLLPPSFNHADSCSSLSESEIQSLSHNSYNYQSKMRNTRHHTGTDNHDDYPQLPDSIPLTSLNGGVSDGNKTHTHISRHDLSRQRATLDRFLNQ